MLHTLTTLNVGRNDLLQNASYFQVKNLIVIFGFSTEISTEFWLSDNPVRDFKVARKILYFLLMFSLIPSYQLSNECHPSWHITRLKQQTTSKIGTKLPHPKTNGRLDNLLPS